VSEVINDTSSGLRHLGSVVARWWLLIFIGTVFAVGVAGFALAAASTRFVSNADVLLAPPGLQLQGKDSAEDVRKVNDLSSTFGQIMVSDEVLSKVIADTNVRQSVDDLRDDIKVATIPQTLVLHVEVTRPKRDEATAIAKAVVARFSERIKNLGTAGSDAQPVTAVSLQAPVTSEIPKNTLRTLLVALIVGFGFTTVVAFTLDRS
jgi:capsular polysaccharide biosynthesis protein